MSENRQPLKQELRRDYAIIGVIALSIFVCMHVFDAPYLLSALSSLLIVFVLSNVSVVRFGRRNMEFHYYRRRFKTGEYLTKPETESIEIVIHWHGYEGDSFELVWSDGTSWYIAEDSGLTLKQLEKLFTSAGLCDYLIEERNRVFRSTCIDHQNS